MNTMQTMAGMVQVQPTTTLHTMGNMALGMVQQQQMYVGNGAGGVPGGGGTRRGSVDQQQQQHGMPQWQQFTQTAAQNLNTNYVAGAPMNTMNAMATLSPTNMMRTTVQTMSPTNLRTPTHSPGALAGHHAG